MVFAYKWVIRFQIPFIRKDHPEESFVKVFHFSSERKSMTTVIPDGDGFKIYSKGAPEVILKKCASIVRRDGSIGKFLPEDEVRIERVVKNMKEKSQLKVMCIGYRLVYPSGGYNVLNNRFCEALVPLESLGDT